MKTLLWSLALIPDLVFAQTPVPEDAAKIQAARTATESVFELGRYLSDIQTLEEKYPKLVLSKDQAKQLLPLLKEIKSTTRLLPDYAKKTLPKVQNLLSAEQRKVVGQIATERQPGSEGGGPGVNRVQFLSYADGGAFNPITNAKTVLGQDFAKLYVSLEKRTR